MKLLWRTTNRDNTTTLYTFKSIFNLLDDPNILKIKLTFTLL